MMSADFHPKQVFFFVEELVHFVDPKEIYQKGSDASTKNDAEPEEEEDFSDDDKELAAKQRRKGKVLLNHEPPQDDSQQLRKSKKKPRIQANTNQNPPSQYPPFQFHSAQNFPSQPIYNQYQTQYASIASFGQTQNIHAQRFPVLAQRHTSGDYQSMVLPQFNFPSVPRSMVAASGNSIFVRSLPLDMRDEQLVSAFANFGQILSAHVAMDKESGLSKGFGFVTYDTPESASVAISQMNGFKVGNRYLQVYYKKS